MKPTRPFLISALICFAIGFLAAPLVAVLHVPQDAAQIVVGINWISGGLAFVLAECVKRELDEDKPEIKPK